MGYRIRVLGTEPEQPSLSYLLNNLRESTSHAVLKIETGVDESWEQLLLAHPNGPEIALIECNLVTSNELGQEELEEFILEVAHYQPASAAQWLKVYLSRIKVIYALQLLSGTDVGYGWNAVHAVQGAIWRKSGGILQADSEGFTNEDGHHILWQFCTTATGKWNMAVLEQEKWIAFEMDLADLDQRKAFMEGRVPPHAQVL
jgi:hypothetical protein